MDLASHFRSTRLSERVQLLSNTTPPEPKELQNILTKEHSVSLIILCTWMGAAPRHIARYSSGYLRLFPSSSILVIETSLADMTYRSQSTLQRTLTPALEVIDRHLSRCSGRTVLHAFSNGGAQTATHLADLLHRNDAFDILILDSCPGVRDAREMARACTIALPEKYYVKEIATGFMYLWSIIYLHTLDVLGIEDAVSSSRRGLVDPEMFGEGVPRLYLCSKEDRIVGFEAVRGHVREARRRGYRDVELVVFEVGAHCGLLREDSGRYWREIRVLVEGGGKGGKCVL